MQQPYIFSGGVMPSKSRPVRDVAANASISASLAPLSFSESNLIIGASL